MDTNNPTQNNIQFIAIVPLIEYKVSLLNQLVFQVATDLR